MAKKQYKRLRIGQAIRVYHDVAGWVPCVVVATKKGGTLIRTDRFPFGQDWFRRDRVMSKAEYLAR